MAKRKRDTRPEATPTSVSPGRAESVAWFALLSAVVLTPLVMSDFGWLGIANPLTYDIYTEPKLAVLRVATVIAFAAWVWAVLVDGRPIRRSVLDRWLLAFGATLIAVTAFSVHPATSVFGHYQRGDGLLSYVVYVAVAFLTVQLADRGSRIRQAGQALFWSGSLVSAYGLFQAAGIDFAPDPTGRLAGRAFSTLGNPLSLGGFLIFVAPVAAALALTERRRGWRVVYWAGSALSAGALVATFSRSAWVGLGVALVVFVAWAWYRRVPLMPAVDGPALLGIAAITGVVTALSRGATDRATDVTQRAGAILEFETGSGLSRVGLWEAAWSAALERPLTGFGLDTARLFLPRYLEPEYARSAEYLAIPDNAHNVVMQSISTMGFVATALLLAVVGVAAWTSGRSLLAGAGGTGRAERTPPASGQVLLAAFWAACAGYVVHLMAAISVPPTTFLLWFAMGLLVAPAGKRRSVVSAPSPRAIAGAVVALSAVFVALVLVPLRADHLHLLGRGVSDPAARIAAADGAVRLAPYYDTYRLTSAIAHADPVVNTLSMTSAENATPELKSSFEQAVGRIRAAREFSPWETDTLSLLAVIYNAGGRHVDSRYFAETIDLAGEVLPDLPYAPQVRLQYALALNATGRTDEAQKVLEELISIEPRMPEAPVELARIHQSRGDADRARAVLVEADGPVVDNRLLMAALQALDRGETIAPVTW